MITQLGKDSFEKRAGITRSWELGKRFVDLSKKLWKKPQVLKKPFTATYSAVKKPARAGVRGLTGTGKFLAKHPHTGVPILAVGGIGALKLKDNAQKNYLHTDPRSMATRRTATNRYVIPGLASPKIEYVDPRLKEYYKQRNLIY